MMIILLFTIALSAQSEALIENKTLEVGRKLKVNTSSIWLSQKGLVKVEQSGTQIFLKGLKPGLVEIKTDQENFYLQIARAQDLKVYTQLRRAHKNIPGLVLEWSANLPTLTGTLYRLDDYKKILNALPRKSEWLFKAQIPDFLKEDFNKLIRHDLQHYSEEISFVFKPELFVPLPSLRQSAHLVQELLYRGIQTQEDSQSLAIEPTVKIELAIAEIRRDKAQEVGLNLPSSAEIKLIPEGRPQLPDLIFSAKSFESTGLGRILARPNIICRNGKEAEFQAGGEFPIKILNARSQNIIWKRYGLEIKVKPKADKAGRLSIAIEAEISNIDMSRAVDGIPALTTNKVSSVFDLQKAKTIILSGLIRNEDSQHKSGWFGLTNIPIFGDLFSSHSWKSSQSEFVIFAKPQLLKEI